MSGREISRIVALGAVLALVTLYFAYSRYRPSECNMDLSLALDRSRTAITQGSGQDAPARCAAYRAHMVLLEGSKRCIVSARSIGPLESEIAAYERLIAQTCTS